MARRLLIVGTSQAFDVDFPVVDSTREANERTRLLAAEAEGAIPGRRHSCHVVRRWKGVGGPRADLRLDVTHGSQPV